MANQSVPKGKKGEGPKYPISKIEPVTASTTFPNDDASKAKRKTLFRRLKQKFNTKQSPVSHISYKTLNEDRASVIYPSGLPLGKPSIHHTSHALSFSRV